MKHKMDSTAVDCERMRFEQTEREAKRQANSTIQARTRKKKEEKNNQNNGKVTITKNRSVHYSGGGQWEHEVKQQTDTSNKEQTILKERESKKM